MCYIFFNGQEQPEEFHESLKQIPMRWRSSLSSIMTTMASNGALDDNGGAQSGNGGEGGMDVAVAGEGRSGKVLFYLTQYLDAGIPEPLPSAFCFLFLAVFVLVRP